MILSFNFSKQYRPQVTEYVANIFEEKLKFDNSNVNVSRTSFCMKINDNFISVGKIQICHNLFFYSIMIGLSFDFIHTAKEYVFLLCYFLYLFIHACYPFVLQSSLFFITAQFSFNYLSFAC